MIEVNCGADLRRKAGSLIFDIGRCSEWDDQEDMCFVLYNALRPVYDTSLVLREAGVKVREERRDRRRSLDPELRRSPNKTQQAVPESNLLTRYLLSFSYSSASDRSLAYLLSVYRWHLLPVHPPQPIHLFTTVYIKGTVIWLIWLSAGYAVLTARVLHPEASQEYPAPSSFTYVQLCA